MKLIPVNNSLERYNCKLGYLKDSTAAAHSVDSDIFNAVIHLSARSKIYYNLYFVTEVLSNRGV